ncbi:MAG: SRPBCC domain-containing protein, partial [Thermomicrobiales bacterium]
MTTTTSNSNAEQTRELVITRTFDAPRNLVYKAWTDPAQLAKWFGPNQFTIPVCELDVRPGGAILIHMM